jgi:hypothetical protein
MAAGVAEVAERGEILAEGKKFWLRVPATIPICLSYSLVSNWSGSQLSNVGLVDPATDRSELGHASQYMRV